MSKIKDTLSCALASGAMYQSLERWYISEPSDAAAAWPHATGAGAAAGAVAPSVPIDKHPALDAVPHLRDFLNRCLAWSERDRPSVADLLQHNLRMWPVLML